MRRQLFSLSLALCLGLASLAYAAAAPEETKQEKGHEKAHADHKPEAVTAPTTPAVAVSPTGSDPTVGVTEHLGQRAAMDVMLTAEDGSRVRFGDLVTMPTILAPVYYSCPNECNVLLGTLANVLPQVGLTPGKDYQVLAVSFDDRDTAATASKRKGDFLNAGAAGFPPQAWRFLSGDEASVRQLMDSVGFGYKRAGDAFKHSIVLIALAPDGKITRYLYGIRPLAFDIAMAATEAAEGKTGLSVKRAIAMCYTYDPQGRKYVFDFMKVAGAGVLFALGLFGLFLAFGGKKRTPRA
jgi:protein SCO1/2